MLVERLTYHQAFKRWEKAALAVEDAERELAQLRRTLTQATAEMFHALHERLKEPLP